MCNDAFTILLRYYQEGSNYCTGTNDCECLAHEMERGDTLDDYRFNEGPLEPYDE